MWSTSSSQLAATTVIIWLLKRLAYLSVNSIEISALVRAVWHWWPCRKISGSCLLRTGWCLSALFIVKKWGGSSLEMGGVHEKPLNEEYRSLTICVMASVTQLYFEATGYWIQKGNERVTHTTFGTLKQHWLYSYSTQRSVTGQRHSCPRWATQLSFPLFSCPSCSIENKRWFQRSHVCVVDTTHTRSQIVQLTSRCPFVFSWLWTV